MYLFPVRLAPQLNADDTEMAKKMVRLWTSFAINGKPYVNETFEWPSVTSND